MLPLRVHHHARARSPLRPRRLLGHPRPELEEAAQERIHVVAVVPVARRAGDRSRRRSAPPTAPARAPRPRTPTTTRAPRWAPPSWASPFPPGSATARGAATRARRARAGLARFWRRRAALTGCSADAGHQQNDDSDSHRRYLACGPTDESSQRVTFRKSASGVSFVALRVTVEPEVVVVGGGRAGLGRWTPSALTRFPRGTRMPS